MTNDHPKTNVTDSNQQHQLNYRSLDSHIECVRFNMFVSDPYPIKPSLTHYLLHYKIAVPSQ